MNITLSAEKETIETCRQYAKKHGTSLNNIIREYLKKISGEDDAAANAREFARLAKNMPGCSDSDFHFNRDEAHDRMRHDLFRGSQCRPVLFRNQVKQSFC